MLSNYKYIVIKLNLGILLCFSIVFNLNAQQFNNWYFPTNNGITFNTGIPTFLSGGQLNLWSSCASISDKNGDLLFYSDGEKIYNRNNVLMPNGSGLLGGFSQTNTALIIPFLSDSSKYYVFTARGTLAYFPGNQATLPYSYSVVDMRQNGGLGDVVSKNNLIRFFSTEKMTAIPHGNGSDIWWICRDWTNNFYSYKITCLGFNNSPVISTVGTNINNSYFNISGGDIKASPDGKYISACYRTYFEIYEFNKFTGKLSNPIKISTSQESYGVEFSPNSKLLYISQFENFTIPTPEQHIVQYSLSVYDSTSIMNSFLKITEIERPDGLGTIAGLQLGPDNKIYSINGFTIDRIENPNVLGFGCNFIDSILIMPNVNRRRLPYSPPFLFASPNVQIPTYTVASDCRTVTLTGKTYIKGNNLTFKWKFGDGDSTVQIVPSGGDTTYTSVTHFYPPGIDTFNVQLFVTSDTVCGQGSAGKKVIVKPPPPTAKFGTAISCNNLTVNFTDSSLLNFNPSITHQWQFFNKNNLLLGSSIVQNPVFTFPTLDTFTVRLIARSFLSCVQADTITKLIILKAKPTANFTYTNSCGSLIANFNNTSTVVADTLQTYYWNFGNGNTATTKNPGFGFAAFGTYPVKLVVTSALGCSSDTTKLPVIIKPKPIANFIYNNNGCVGVPVTLQDSAYINNGTITQRYWLLPNGISFTAAAINPSFSVGGNYVVKYAVTSNLGCVSDTLPKTIFIESNPIAAIASITANGGCQNQAINFTSQSSIATGTIQKYTWLFTPTDSSNQPNPTYSFSNFGNYTIQHKVSSNNGCSSNIATANLVIESNPQVSFTNTLACLQKPVNFVNTSSNVFGAMVNSEWLIGNSLQSNNPTGFTYTFNQNGNYAVTFKTTTANGCSNTATKTILVEPALASAGNDTTVLENTPFVLQGNGGVAYFWQPPLGLDDVTKQQPIGKLNNSQQYSVQVTTAQGCVGYDTVMVSVLRNLIIPNAFSPNGDGINETWSIDQLKDYPQATVQIFSRNGQLVYNAKGNNSTAWNGRLNNQALPVGTYYYIINLNTVLRNKPFTGWVLLVR